MTLETTYSEYILRNLTCIAQPISVNHYYQWRTALFSKAECRLIMMFIVQLISLSISINVTSWKIIQLTRLDGGGRAGSPVAVT